jgi:hypothetical protein
MKCFYRYAAAMLGLMLVASSGALAPSAVAQSSWDTAPADDRTQYEAPRTPDPAGTGVPDWAEGSGGSVNGFQGEPNKVGAYGAEMNSIDDNDDPFGGGNEPDLVPIDGGLSLLALVGAGYAARKLRERDGEDDDMEDDMP